MKRCIRPAWHAPPTGHTGHVSTPLGRDGRSLVDTAMATYSFGWKRASSFRAWATRHGVRPATYQPSPNGGQPTALWDLADIAEALDKRNTAA